MMQIIGADFIVLCNEAFDVLKKGGICFDESGILEIDSYLALRKKYPQTQALFYESCAITPALANPHLHLEFSQNNGLLHFGDFGEWLDSVIIHREKLMDSHLEKSMQQGIRECLESGVGFIGAISSRGYDLETLANSPLRVLHFNEIIGSNTQIIDTLYQDFLTRLQESQTKKSTHFIPAVALHAPYSVHPKLLRQVLEIAKKQNLFVSVHFLESYAEKEWLESSSGYFKTFYQKFFQSTMESFYSIESFLKELEGMENIYFTHCLEADSNTLEIIKAQRGKIISCPKSNRLLNNKFLPLNPILEKGIPLCLGTDGKSSNNSLSLLDELRIALFAYPEIPLESLARLLLLSVTRNVFLNTSLKLGVLKQGNLADFAVFKLPKTQEFLAQNLILYAKNATKLYINGKEVLEYYKDEEWERN